MERSKTINELVEEAYATASEKGWHETERGLLEELALVHSEVSEAVEAYRERGLEEWKRPSDGKPEGVIIELADAVIRIFDICGGILGADLESAITRKMEFNRTRPYRHGGKRA